MADIAVSVSMGVMKPLLEKLGTLIGDEYKKLKGLRKEVSFLKSELSDMNALLEKMDDADELDPQARIWRKDIIEMSYNIEDYIDDFMVRVGEATGDNVGVLKKASHYLRTFKDRLRFANQFKEINTLVIEAGERRKRYILDQCIPSTGHVIVDPRLSALYQKSANLVGIDSQKEQIITWVMDESQELKVMSIVGFGGLGKTTLANEVYREVGGNFNRKAFVSISQNPNIVKLLNSIMLQLGIHPYSQACELQDHINKIVEHLHDMRYLIIVDDLWDIRAWNTISCAFPQNVKHSRVMITTRIENVAGACCGNHGFIHKMNPLSEEDSRKLFFNRIFGPEDPCPPDFMEVSSKILKKCAGLPLAIITMASVIACQPRLSMDQCAEYIQTSMDSELSTNPTYEDMMHIIDFSYKNLPRHLKACFLYLGTYPEDHKISRVELVRRWVAEGFVSCSRGQLIWDVGESYFCELANRSMIQPAYEDEDVDDTQIKMTHCKVHDMMLELILRKCREDNFISLIDDPKMMPKGNDKVIRRLTIDLRGEKGSITVAGNSRHLSQLRALSIFGGNCGIPNIVEFKFMRILFIDVDQFETAIDLTGINHLSQLRYLRVRGDGQKVLLPAQIRGLQLLETLDLSGLEDIGGLPEIVDVPRLCHVSVPWYVTMRLPDGIGTVKSLHSLSGFSLAKSSLESITSVGELTDLEELWLDCTEANRGVVVVPMPMAIAALLTSVEKLSNLRSLRLWCSHFYCCGDAMQPSFSPPFYKIEELCLHVLMFSSVPRWIGHLRCLHKLELQAKQILQEDFNILGTRLTSLIHFYLRIVHVPTERIMIGCSTGFKVLKQFWFDCDGASCLTFEAGAMPDLQKLQLIIDLDEWDKATPVGLHHLPSLNEIAICTATVKPGSATKTLEERRTAAALMRGMFREIAEALPTRPAVHGPLGRIFSRSWEWRAV